MRFVGVKSNKQQDIQSMHRIRDKLVVQKASKANQIRGLVSEYGLVAPVGINKLREAVPLWLEDAENGLSALFCLLLLDLFEDLMEQFRLAQQKTFSVSGEAHPGQGQLFDEAESEELAEEAEASTVEGHICNIPRRKPLPADLPREAIVLDIPEENMVCHCGTTLHKIGEDRSERLAFIPAKVKVIETVRPKYVCRCSETEDDNVEIKQAPVLPAIIPKSIATPSLLSQIVTSKYQYGLPLYRQESMFKQYGIDLSRKTMADWMIRCSESLEVLYTLLRQMLLRQSVSQADETTLKVVNENKTPEEKHQIRQENAMPLLHKFKAWLEKSSLQVIPKSKMGDAINYSLNQWHKLTRYTEDGRLNIDNNCAESAIKTFVIGRKNSYDLCQQITQYLPYAA